MGKRLTDVSADHYYGEKRPPHSSYKNLAGSFESPLLSFSSDFVLFFVLTGGVVLEGLAKTGM